MKKIVLTVSFIVSLLQITINGFSQNIAGLRQERYISGLITDAEDGIPIPSVTVFIANTTVGTATDLKGYYRLKIPGEGSYQLTISHVGYQSVFKDIESGNASVQFDVALQSIELDEFTVATRVRFRQSDISLFWKTILGKTPSRRTIQATNPEVVYYYYNPETRILKVTCREPLQIVNHETGYQIRYVLDNFTHDYNTNTTNWYYQHQFTELEPENDRQLNNWVKKRQEVYQVSLIKFIKSLYNNSLKEDGFVLATLRQNPLARNPFQIISLTPDKIISTNPIDNSKILNLSNLPNEQVMLICYGKPVNDFDIKALQEAINVTGRWSSSGLFRNLLSGGSIRIFPDGTYTNRISMAPMDTSDPINGLYFLLPTDYLPGSLNATTTIEDMAENISDYDKVVQHFNRQLSIYPQEKIHLHTDRDVYISGEKIWFKAYIADAQTHQYPTPSRYMYVELISPVDTLMYRVMVRQSDGMFYGNLFLTEYVPTGNYTLRAYTRYMENLGDDYFFKKNIRIENLAAAINQQRPTANKGMLKDDFAISFFPEGGNLPEGVLCKVAFKALNINGYPETVSGELIDENGVHIAAVETFYAGMGVFELMPEAGKRFFLKCKNQKGLEKQFVLPQPSPVAYSLAANNSDHIMLVKVNRAVNSPDIPCYLLVHCRGEVLYFSEWDNMNEDVVFTEDEFPAGIIQFVLFDEQMNPLSERLVFNKNYDEVNVTFLTDKETYKTREHVISSLSLFDSNGNPLTGHLSVAITDDKDISVDSMNTILSTLLLSSELKGYIDHPAWYLQDNSASAIALDYLMLTHGWRRYDVPAIVKGNPKHPQISFQVSQQISGKIKNLILSRSVPDSEIVIMASDGAVGLTSTDENGLFVYQDFEYPDSTTFIIQALSRRGSNRVELVMNMESFPKLIHATQSPFVEIPEIREETKNESEPNAFIMKAEQRSRYDEDMWMIYLDEVEITARRIDRRDAARLQYWANSSSSATIKRAEMEKSTLPYVSDYLRLTSGVTVYPDGKVYIRSMGPSGRAGNGLPLVLIDGIEHEWPDTTSTMTSRFQSPLDRIPVSEIESIDVFKGTDAVVFGVRGANGVISITTRRGENSPFVEKPNLIQYAPLGYQKPVEFYAPQYETVEAKHLIIPDFRTTIFWKPDIVISEDTEKTIFDFYTSDFPTTYSVVIEGLTTDGKIIRQVEKITITSY